MLNPPPATDPDDRLAGYLHDISEKLNDLEDIAAAVRALDDRLASIEKLLSRR